MPLIRVKHQIQIVKFRQISIIYTIAGITFDEICVV